MVTTLTTFEAIDACIEYHGENCRFDPEKKAFAYTGGGWGSPAAIYNSLYDGKENHHYKGKPYAFKLRQFKDALADGAFVVKGRKVPIKSSVHSTIQPSETVYLSFDAADNCARHNGEIVYVDLLFMPKEEYVESVAARKAGRPSMASVISSLHEKNQHLLESDMKQAQYAKILQDTFRKNEKKKPPPSLAVINKYLKVMKIFSDKSL